MASALDQLKEFTTVVADTGDIQGILCLLSFFVPKRTVFCLFTLALR